eukprot:CAMPEP_0185580288 /NCGR_PEP_ID=MMETSP0434-20130131/16028_1 /TAXON_ID=626734 ORGANISM="Favella taraikaensis, Strain Fe Narragansett Bay" /NCGR_SAMPLE_ID=MMETSP0434 /ASSEMBLY_ACC=CAM_ASM_000379 /LENGTH=71 /DNA_ID=CAMNT_0028198509 /DNA_START=36 /DNA_END=251 /DNA_ORIENTATION=+
MAASMQMQSCLGVELEIQASFLFPEPIETRKQWDILPWCDKKHEGLEWNKPYNCVKCVLRRPESKDLEAFY